MIYEQEFAPSRALVLRGQSGPSYPLLYILRRIGSFFLLGGCHTAEHSHLQTSICIYIEVL